MKGKNAVYPKAIDKLKEKEELQKLGLFRLEYT